MLLSSSTYCMQQMDDFIANKISRIYNEKITKIDNHRYYFQVWFGTRSTLFKFSPQNKYLLEKKRSRNVELIDIQKKQTVRNVDNAGFFRYCIFSPDCNTLHFRDKNKQPQILYLTANNHVPTNNVHINRKKSPQITEFPNRTKNQKQSSNKKYLFAVHSDNNTAELIHIRSGKKIKEFACVHGAKFSPDSRHLLILYYFRKAELIKLSKNGSTIIKRFVKLYSSLFSPNGAFLIAKYHDPKTVHRKNYKSDLINLESYRSYGIPTNATHTFSKDTDFLTQETAESKKSELLDLSSGKKIICTYNAGIMFLRNSNILCIVKNIKNKNKSTIRFCEPINFNQIKIKSEKRYKQKLLERRKNKKLCDLRFTTNQ